LQQKEKFVNPWERDYGYIEYFRKAMENTPGSYKDSLSLEIKYHEGCRDYFTPSLWPVNHLIQIDEKPNLELNEPKWELYKISITFHYFTGCK